MTYTNTETEFSNATHDALIKNNFYIKLFKNKNIKIISTTVTRKNYTKEAQMLDQNYGVDYRIIINDGEWNEISFTIQERFRRLKYKSYQDLTIRYETKCGFKSELSKINADYFIYGYAEVIDDIVQPNQIIVVNIPILKMAFAMNKLSYTTRMAYDGAKFITFKFSNLSKIDAMFKIVNF